MNTKLKILVTATFIGTWGALMAVHSARADSSADSLHISVYQNGPGSSALLAGDTTGAIKRAEKAARLPQPFGALVNLCAAYIIEGELEVAQEFCMRADQTARKGDIGGVLRDANEVRDARLMAQANLRVLEVLQAQAHDSDHLLADTRE